MHREKFPEKASLFLCVLEWYMTKCTAGVLVAPEAMYVHVVIILPGVHILACSAPGSRVLTYAQWCAGPLQTDQDDDQCHGSVWR